MVLMRCRHAFIDLVTLMSPPHVPAVFWDLLPFEWQVLLPNYLRGPFEVTVGQLRAKFVIPWGCIMGRCSATWEGVLWLLDMTKANRRVIPRNAAEYAHSMFALYEQFRRYFIDELTVRSAQEDLYLTMQNTKITDRGPVMILSVESFEDLPLSLVEKLCAERFRLWRRLDQHDALCRCDRVKGHS